MTYNWKENPNDWKHNPNHMGHLWWVGQGIAWCGFWLGLAIVMSGVVSCVSENYEYMNAEKKAALIVEGNK